MGKCSVPLPPHRSVEKQCVTEVTEIFHLETTDKLAIISNIIHFNYTFQFKMSFIAHFHQRFNLVSSWEWYHIQDSSKLEGHIFRGGY